MPGIEDERNRILGSVGEDALDALRSIGIDPEHGVESVLIDRFAREAYLTRKDPLLDLKSLPLQDLLTSELVLLQDQSEPAKHTAELERRLNLLGLDQDQVQGYISLDQQALGKKDPHVLAEGTGVSLYITYETTPKLLPTPDSLLTSELVAIMDDANAAIARDHHGLPGPAFSAAAEVSGWGSGKTRYHEELVKRLQEIGLDEIGIGLFIRNESLILERERWGYNPEQMSWDPGMTKRREQFLADPERLKAFETEVAEKEQRVREMLIAFGREPELIDKQVRSIRTTKTVDIILGK